MSISSDYKNEFLALRQILLTKSKKSSVVTESAKNFVQICNKIGWIALPSDIASLYEGVAGTAIRQAMEEKNKKLLQINLEEDSFFANLLTKEVQDKKEEIKNNALSYYSTGNFGKYISIFTRYIKKTSDYNETDMYNCTMKFFIASAIKKNFKQCEEDIRIVMKNYNLYDYNILIFLIKIINEEFSSICSSALSVKINISPDILEFLSEKDLSFCFSVSLLADFKEPLVKELYRNSELLGNVYIEKYPQDFAFLKSYQKCQFEEVLAEFEKIKERLKKEPIFVSSSEAIYQSLKKNILKEILFASSAVEISYLTKLFKIEKEDTLIEDVMSLVEQENFEISIDDISKRVYRVEKDPLDDTLNICLNQSKKAFGKFMNFSLKCLNGKAKKLTESEKLSDCTKFVINDFSAHGIGGLEFGMGLGA